MIKQFTFLICAVNAFNFILIFYILLSNTDRESTVYEIQYASQLSRTVKLRKNGNNSQINLSLSSSNSWQSCYMHNETCFNYNKCFKSDINERLKRLKVFVYEPDMTDLPSSEFKELIEALIDSDYYEPDARKACLFVPAIDLLNERRVSNQSDVEYRLKHLKHWSTNGKNHLIFNMMPKSEPRLGLNVQAAIVTSSGFDSLSYRNSFDVSIPFFNHLTAYLPIDPTIKRGKYLVTSVQTNLDKSTISELKQIGQAQGHLAIFTECTTNYLTRCNVDEPTVPHSYATILQESQFCIIFKSSVDSPWAQMSLFDSLKFNCIPIIVLRGDWILPFDELIDWNSICVQIHPAHLDQLFEVVAKIPQSRVEFMRRQLQQTFDVYFSSIRAITHKTFDLLSSRLSPDYRLLDRNLNYKTPFIIPYTSRTRHFTAFIIGYNQIDRVNKLTKTLSNLGQDFLIDVFVLWYGPTNDLKSLHNRHQVRLMNNGRFSHRVDVNTEQILLLNENNSLASSAQLSRLFRLGNLYPTRALMIKTEGPSLDVPMLYDANFNHLYRQYFNKHAAEHLCENARITLLVQNLTNSAVIFVKEDKTRLFKCASIDSNCKDAYQVEIDNYVTELTQRCMKHIKPFRSFTFNYEIIQAFD